jgi:glycosyltransferase involved in cell wall biosynthesis
MAEGNGMYRVRLNYDKPRWAYYRRCRAIQKYAPAGWEVDIGPWHPNLFPEMWDESTRYDLIMSLVPDVQQRMRQELAKRGETETVLVGGLNVGYGNHRERLRMSKTGADHIVVNNRDCWWHLGRPENTTCISNGVDRNIFRVTVPIEQRTPRVLWSGSRYHCVPRDGNPESIKGWSEVLEPLGKRLDAAGIQHSFRRSISDVPERCRTTEAMVEWYNTGTVYVCTSSTEGTPNPALEAASCGCTMVTTSVGNMPELIEHGRNGLIVDRDVDAVLTAIQLAIDTHPTMATQMQKDIAWWDWSMRAKQYYDLFERLIREAKK